MTYELYSNYVGTLCSTNNLTGFKSHPSYVYMLEHVSPELGHEYLECILKNTSITTSEIEEFCVINDSVGEPRKINYNFKFLVSPSNLRYVYQAHLILTHVKTIHDTRSVDIVEIGGGYGGLCLAVHHFSAKYGVKINSYTICDLTNIICLQRMYLNRVKPEITVDFVDAETYGENINRDDMFLISNYCFSEISESHQVKYRQTLFPKISHGFFAWNCIPVYDLGIGNLRIEPEIPDSGIDSVNKYVYF